MSGLLCQTRTKTITKERRARAGTQTERERERERPQEEEEVIEFKICFNFYYNTPYTCCVLQKILIGLEIIHTKSMNVGVTKAMLLKVWGRETTAPLLSLLEL